jgi:carboxylate-amine ligase
VTATSPYPPSADTYDEAFHPHGAPREEGGAAIPLLGRDLGALASGVRDALAQGGVSFRSAGGDAEFLMCPVPRVIGAAEWAALEAGLAQRVRALDAFVADAYGPRRAVAEGVIPERVIDTAEGYEPAMYGVRPPGGKWVGIAGLDLVRDASGEMLVLEDNLCTPSGFAYAVEARRVLLSHLDVPPELVPRPIDGVIDLLRETLRTAAPEVENPYTVVLTDGPDNSAAYEHAWAAEQLGIPLVEPEDLELRGDVLRHDGRRVDVLYRRTNADTVDTDVGRLLIAPVRAGTLGLVNAFGTGVADDKLVHAYVEDLVRFHLGEEPLLRSVPTFDLCAPGQLERALDELDALVVKPRRGYGGIGVVVCAHAERDDVERLRGELRERPGDFIAQPRVEISLHPTVIDGALQPRHVDLRPFVFMRGPDDAAVMPGGLTRVAFGEGAMVVNSTQNGGAKDTWVLP